MLTVIKKIKTVIKEKFMKYLSQLIIVITTCLFNSLLAFTEDVAPPTTTWADPDCTVVTGLPSVIIFDKNTQTYIGNRKNSTSEVGTLAMVALESGVLLAELEGVLYSSTDSGCRWSRKGRFNRTGVMKMVATGAHTVLATTQQQSSQIWSIDTSKKGKVMTPLANAPGAILGMGANPENPEDVRILAADGFIYQLNSGEQKWSPVGKSALDIARGSTNNFAAFDPANWDRVIFGRNIDGLIVSHDAGNSWLKASGLTFPDGDRANAFEGHFARYIKDVVFLVGLDLGTSEKYIYKSEDGGLHFYSVVKESRDVTISNGVNMSIDKHNRIYYGKGSDVQDFTRLYEYDDYTKTMKWWDNYQYYGMGAVVAHPNGRHIFVAVHNQAY